MKFNLTMNASWICLSFLLIADIQAADTLPPVTERFAKVTADEVPNFQKHVVPLLSRLGCNGRACHGSFQGRGDFRLSLFGYDFVADYQELNDPESPRIDIEEPLDSLIIVKPTDEDMHEGGKRYSQGGWEYRVLLNWVRGGESFDEENIAQLDHLEINPLEIQFSATGQTKQLNVVAVWSDGSREDVTPLVRYKSSDKGIAEVDQNGQLTSGERQGDTHIILSYDKAVVPIPVLRPVSKQVGRRYPQVPTPTTVDQLVVEKLRKLGIVPADVAGDAEFLRRVSLDMTGTLPTAAQVESFLADKSKGKRGKKIDELLQTPAYAAWWATKLCDFTGNNDQQLNNTSPVRNAPGQIWYRWIEQRVAQNMPYDELTAGIVLGISKKPGQSYLDYCEEMTDLHRGDRDASIEKMETMPYYWARRDFRNPPERAISFAYAFMGIRIQCAQCHKHPFDVWSKKDFAEFSSFFTGVLFANAPLGEDRAAYQTMIKDLGLGKLNGGQLRRELSSRIQDGKTVPFPVVTTRAPRQVLESGRPSGPVITEASILGTQTIQFEKDQDIREPLMQWLRSKKNPYFARAFVNRVWANYFNVGIVDPPDDLSLANPPSNEALLDYLTQGFLDHDFDMKWLHKEIANSRTYQLSWKTNETNEGDHRNFSHQVPRRLPAEVTVDAIAVATASDQEAQRLHEDMAGRAISIPTSSERFLQGNNATTFGLMVFGRSTRESNCECDRSMDPTLLQTVYMQNDQDVHRLLDRRNTGWLYQISTERDWSFGGAGLNSTRQAKPPQNYAQLMANLDNRIKALRQAGNEKEVANLVKRRRAYVQRFGPVDEGTQAADPTASKPQVERTEDIVNQAYLRTLSRYPSEQEMIRSVQYIQDSEDPVNGVRGLLWALVNTKEFVVNH
ncbi:MAG: DUF1549 and DUF1553 domain-containing protein [Planctomycetota bacterium]|nr:DUF1549 and DUF1553 domain-containing protein [Planctomycetota bacterium]